VSLLMRGANAYAIRSFVDAGSVSVP
jgi:hypothetical protein